MASPNTQNFDQVVSTMAAQIQGSAPTATNFGKGTFLRAICNATAGVVMWLQGLFLYILTLTRASTSFLADLDSWMADFGFFRLAAVSSLGQATFARFTATNPAVVPVGTPLTTADGTQQFVVIADAANPAYSAAAGGYPIAANVASTNATVQAVTPGSGGNIAAGTLTQIGAPISGVDTVTNAAAFTNGLDAESDPAFRARFVLYINSLSKGTKAAIAAAIANVQQGLSQTITENFDYPGTTADNGNFFVVVDDGTGAPPSGLLTTVNAAVDLVRALTVRFTINSPSVVNATIVLTIDVATGYSKPALQSAAQAAIVAMVNALGLGVSLPYTRIAQAAYDSSPGITNVRLITMNGGTADLAASQIQVIKTSNGLVSVN